LSGFCQAQEPGSARTAQILDEIYTKPDPPFNTLPSAFLARAVEGLTAGEALDAAMGQGRNSLFLARRGWLVTGYDDSSVGLTQATKAAAREGLILKTELASHEAFDFGTNRWDLVVMIFPETSMEEQFVRKVKASLKPGGHVVVEQFQRATGGRRHRSGQRVVPVISGSSRGQV